MKGYTLTKSTFHHQFRGATGSIAAMCSRKHSSYMAFYAWFTFLSRQRKTRTRVLRYICLVCHVLDLFSFCLEALGNMMVNQSRVKGNENVSPRYRKYCDYILVQFLNIDCGMKFSEKCGRMKLS